VANGSRDEKHDRRDRGGREGRRYIHGRTMRVIVKAIIVINHHTHVCLWTDIHRNNVVCVAAARAPAAVPMYELKFVGVGGARNSATFTDLMSPK